MKTLEETKEFKQGEKAGWEAYAEAQDIDKAFHSEFATPPKRFADSISPAHDRWSLGFHHGVAQAERASNE